MVSEPLMASSSNTIFNPNHITSNQSTQISFSFSFPVKLDRSNFMLWRKQVLTTIRGNRLEHLISDNQVTPDRYIAHTEVDGSIQKVENPTFVHWRAHDQTLLGWILSSISEGILSSILNCDSAFEAWKCIEK